MQEQQQNPDAEAFSPSFLITQMPSSARASKSIRKKSVRSGHPVAGIDHELFENSDSESDKTVSVEEQVIEDPQFDINNVKISI